MRGSADRYYAGLSERYDAKIRQLVPRYDELVGCALGLVVASRPRSVIDVGAGPGSLDALLLDRLPNLRLTALDASPEMVAVARTVLAPFGDRAAVVLTDVSRFRSDAAVDAVFSSLVLHNLTSADREHLLATIRGWLTPDGTFVWADLIRLPDAATQHTAVAYRRAFALAAGCDPALVDENFRKEANEDCPMTSADMVSTLKRCGYTAARVEWTHDTFAVVTARSAGPGRARDLSRRTERGGT
jgi:tRNA (cmo5U34)-methyltransferase